MRPRLTAATSNPAKLQEIRRLVWPVADVQPLPLDPRNPEFASLSAETGDSIETIAIEKAIGWSRALCERGFPSPVIATDGGLVIPGLGDAWDPRLTRRFAGEQVTDRDRAERLLELAAGLSGSGRNITWIEAAALANNGELIGSWTATSEPGRLATTIDAALIDASTGFWIPTLWEVPGVSGRRLASLTDAERTSFQDHWSRLQGPVQQAIASLPLTQSRYY